MKLKAAGIVCVLVIVGAWVYVHAQATASPALPTGPNGRYQLAAVDIEPGKEWGKTAIRIDTQTGKTWALIEYGDVTADGKEGEHHLGWAELREIR